MSEKGTPKVFWYVDISSREVEAPNGYEANRNAKKLLEAEDFEPELAGVDLARVVCCGEDMEEVVGEDRRVKEYRCKKCGATISASSINNYNPPAPAE